MITFRKVKFTQINEDAPMRYRIEKELLPFVEKRIIGSFEKTLKEKTEFSDERRPQNPTTLKFLLDEINFLITVKSTTKRPSYKEIYTELLNWLNTLKREHGEKLRREGVLTIKSQPFVSLDLVINRINALHSEIIEGREGVSFTINYEVPSALSSLVKDFEEIKIDPVREYGVFTPGNGIVYVQANELKEYWEKEFVIPFDSELYKMAGYVEGVVPPERIEAKYQISDYYFYVILEPYISTSYAGIIKGLISDEKRKMGDLIKIQMGIVEPELEIYNLKVKNGKKYISLDGLLKRLEDLFNRNTSRELRKKIEIYHL